MPASDARTSEFPTCSVCAERVGVYERAWAQFDDGTRRLTSLASMNGDPAHAVRVWHAACYAPHAR